MPRPLSPNPWMGQVGFTLTTWLPLFLQISKSVDSRTELKKNGCTVTKRFFLPIYKQQDGFRFSKCHLGLFLCLDRLGLGFELKNVQFSRCEHFWGVQGRQEDSHLAGEDEGGTNTFQKVRQ